MIDDVDAVEWVVREPPRLKRDWVGRRVRARRQLETGQVIVPGGALGIVRYKKPGTTTIAFDACLHCGVQPIVRVDDVGEAFEFVARRK